MYDVLMIDPPWPVAKIESNLRPNQTKALDYPVLSVPGCFDLLDSEVLCLAVPMHTVFMWTTEKYLVDTELAMIARGYRRHARFVWDKGNGSVAPTAMTVRWAHEYLIWYYKPKFQPIALGARGKFRTIIREKSREHSRKPDAAYWMIEELYPDARRIDVFSREARPGWDQWGNEPQRNTHQMRLAL